VSPGKVEVASLVGAMRENVQWARSASRARESAKCNERSPPSFYINIYVCCGIRRKSERHCMDDVLKFIVVISVGIVTSALITLRRLKHFRGLCSLDYMYYLT